VFISAVVASSSIQDTVRDHAMVYKVSKYVLSVALILSQESFLRILLPALSMSPIISASTGVVFSVALLISHHALVVVSHESLISAYIDPVQRY